MGSEAMGSKWGTSLLESSVKEFTKIDGIATSYAMSEIKENVQKWVEQDVDLVLMDLELKMANHMTKC